MIGTADMAGAGSEVPAVVITEFMRIVGGKWEPWPGDKPGVPPPDDWLLETVRIVSSPIYEKQIDIDGVKLFSFRTSNGKEWDAISGWQPLGS